jgi:MYXO-CTERM domain-containing protein
VPATTTTTKPVVGTSALPVKGVPIALVIVAAVGALVGLRRRRVAA